MALKGWSFRSGGAQGADTAFSDGWCDAREVDARIPEGEVYLPWNGFNALTIGEHCCLLITNKETIYKAQEILKLVHPAYDRLTRGPLALHTRNVFQVLGANLQTPSRGLVGYAKTDSKGAPTGGTATAIKIAQMHNIPVRNLYKQEDREFIEDFVERNK